MTLGILLMYIGLAAIGFTLAVVLVWKKHKSWMTSFLQNFTGVLFLVSGWVKAVDPMGTAFKMEQYFAEFEATLTGTWFGFLAPLFPWLSEQAIAFSVFMIILEIVVGLMLVLGHKPKITAWLFLSIVGFFTALTGFTFLTGYVPNDANFFSFGSWAGYNETNMRVTDCGCFGDFIKLEPRTSFFKDVVLLFPAIWFVFRHKAMHQLLTARRRAISLVVATVLLFIYCLSNYAWDLPHADFRPFKVTTNVREQRTIENQAAAAAQVIAFRIKNKASGEVLDVPSAEYTAHMGDYPETEWKFIDQIRAEPTIPLTKISEFEVLSSDGHDMTDAVLEVREPQLMLVCYKLKSDNGDGWNEGYTRMFSKIVLPIVQAAKQDGISSFLIAGGADGEQLANFARTVGLDCPMYEADDILLKTIIRSNPGFVLLQDGQILGKWHVKKVPDWSVMKELIQ